LLLFSLTCLQSHQCQAANDIYDKLVENGVEISATEIVKLPRPVLTDGLDGTIQRQAIEKLLDGKYDWDNFTRKSVVSPFLLKIAEGEQASNQIGRRVDLYFIVFGSLSKLSSDNFLHDQLNLAAATDEDAENGSVKILSGEELGKRGLSTSQEPDDPRWVAVESTLLNKVRISLTTQNFKTVASDSVLIASILDPTFQNDADYPNCWRPISIDDAGRRQIGKPQIYVGLGSYVKATKLIEPTGAIFCEYHLAYAEPPGWFHGANLLRSKLPIASQQLVRKLRRSVNEN
jgi:hypothetical protein